MIFALIIVIYCVLVVIAYGIKMYLRADVDNLSICLKCYIFDWIEVFCIKVFVCQDKFYYQINKRQLNIIEKQDNKDDSKRKKKRKKLKIGLYVSKLWSKKPSITLRRLSINYAATFEDIKNKALIDSSAIVVTDSLIAANSQKLKIKDFQLENIGDESTFSGVEIECLVGLMLLKIVLFALYAIIVKKKYMVAA